MPILSSIAGAAAKAYGMMANAKRIITDTFNRANGSLGTTSSGHPWSVLRGTWSISSSQATSSTAGSSYPLASVDLGAQNIIVSADITDGGPGVAFWVTDANSWWASSVNYRTTSGCTGAGGNSSSGGGDCGTYTSPTYGPSTCSGPGGNGTSGGGNCGTFYPATSGTACSWTQTGSTTSSGFAILENPCTGELTTNVISSSTTYSCSGGKTLCNTNQCCDVVPPLYSCSNCTSATSSTVYTVYANQNYTPATPGTLAYWSGSLVSGPQLTQGYYSGSTQTTYHTDLKLYSSVSGTVTNTATSTLNSNTSGYSKANSIKVTTAGESISVQAFSSAGLSSQLGSTLTYSATGANRGTKSGIVKTPSDANAGSVLDNFATENLV